MLGLMKRQEFRRKKYGICRIKKTDYCRNNRSESIRRAVCIWKGNRLQVTPNYAEGSLNADDAQVEYDKEFNYAEVTEYEHNPDRGARKNVRAQSK